MIDAIIAVEDRKCYAHCGVVMCVIARAAMTFSSVSVITNALRLRKIEL